MNRKVITLSGRQGSGKTEFAHIAVKKYGFTKIAIADRLKEVVAELYNIPLINLIDPILKQKELDRPWLWNKDIAHRLEQITGLNLTIDIENQEFKKPRKALQYIGTDVIRLVDQDFHIKECIKKIENINSDIIIDDQRFPSEKDSLQRFNPVEYFIIRPYYFTYSNHASEVSLNRNHFQTHILNTRSISTFQNTINSLLKSKNIDKIIKLNNKLNSNNDYNHNAFLEPNQYNSYVSGYLSGDGCIKSNSVYSYHIEVQSIDIESLNKIRDLVCPNKNIHSRKNLGPYSDKMIHMLTLHSPYLIEDLKYWNNIPRTILGVKNKVPDIIKDNSEYIKYWLTGLLDADGGIYLRTKKTTTKNKTYSYEVPFINFLASEEVIDFIRQFLNRTGHKSINNEVNNLYNLTYQGEDTLNIIKLLKNEYCMSRKWYQDQIKELV